MKGIRQKKSWFKKFVSRLEKTAPCAPRDQNLRYGRPGARLGFGCKFMGLSGNHT